MNLPEFTIITKSGVRYGADQITATVEDGTARPMVSFVGSGRMHSIPASEVARVEFYYDAERHYAICPKCDQSLSGSPMPSVP